MSPRNGGGETGLEDWSGQNSMPLNFLNPAVNPGENAAPPAAAAPVWPDAPSPSGFKMMISRSSCVRATLGPARLRRKTYFLVIFHSINNRSFPLSSMA